jgi:hypothetical protein
MGDRFTSADILLTTCLDWAIAYGVGICDNAHPYLERIRILGSAATISEMLSIYPGPAATRNLQTVPRSMQSNTWALEMSLAPRWPISPSERKSVLNWRAR